MDEQILLIKDLPPSKKRKLSSSSSNESKKKFVEGWFKNPLFMNWIEKVNHDVHKARCNRCKQNMTADISVLKKHIESTEHKKNTIVDKSTSKINQFIKSTDENVKVKKLNESVKSAEIMLAAFFAEHAIPFRGFDHLVPVLKKMFPDSEIAKQLSTGRTKGTEIIKNVIGETEKNELTQIMNKKLFSILTDEATDISTTKTSCILVRYHDEKSGRIVSKFWNLVQVLEPGKATQATGQHLYQKIIESFEERKINKENIIGFGSDGCNVMMGEKNSVSSRLKKDFPGITILKCICHSLAKCASYACEKLPHEPEQLARLVYSYFSSSAKRQCEYYEFQKFTDTEIHKLLQPSQTRWLSLSAVVERFVEQWDALLLFFTDQHLNKKVKGAQEIYKQMVNKSNKLFFQFLNWALPIITKANQYFQSSKVVIAELHERMSTLYTTLLKSYMKDQYVHSTDLWKIDPQDEGKFKPDYQMYLGSIIMSELSKPEIKADTELIKYFYHCTRKFLIQACVEIKARYEFENPVMDGLKMFKPENALSIVKLEKTPSLVPFLQLLPRVCRVEKYQAIDDEWRELPSHEFDESRDILIKMTIDEFWNNMYWKKNGGNEYLFRNLAECVLAILSLPHSNCDSERIFSEVNRIKTKNRNKTIVPTIRGVLFASQNIRASGNCVQFKPSAEMLSRMTKDSLYTKSNVSINSSTKPCSKESGGEQNVEEEDDFIFDNIFGNY